MEKHHLLIALVISLVLNLLLGIALVCLIPRLGSNTAETTAPTEITVQPTVPSEVPTTLPTLPETAPAETAATEPAPTQPPATEAPATQPPATEAPEEYIGSLYTRKELKQLDNTLIVYGPGTAKNGNPPPYAGPAQEKYGKYGGHFIESDQGVIYLTFDCGYEHFVDGQPLTGLILDTLKQKDVQAVFFVTMSYVKSNPELVRRMIDEGHIVGNHSSNHHSMPSLSIDAMAEEIMELHNYMEKHFSYKMHLFRPPSGEFSIRSLAVTQSLGYDTVHWSFAYADWDTDAQPEAPAALDKILSCHHHGAIYLLHAVSATNARILADVIDGLEALGYRLELLS